MAWTAPRTWVASEVVTAAIMNTHVRDNLKAIGDAWTAFTPVWSALTTNPAIGNGSITGAFINPGKLAHYRIRILMGSTTTYGAGAYLISLPVTALPANESPCGIITMIDASAGGARYIATAGLASSTSLIIDLGAAAVATPTAPFTFANTDAINVSGTLEVA